MISRRTFIAMSMLLGASGATSLYGCSQTTQISRLDATYFLYDTVIDVSLYSTAQVLSELEQELIRYEQLFSRTREGSDIYRINESQGTKVEVDPLTADILARSLSFCAETEGLFNIALGRVTELWDFSTETIPDPDALSEALLHTDYRKVLVEGTTVQLIDPQIKLELGGVAKGYIADLAVKFLRERNCQNALLNLGGNTYAMGTKEGGEQWRIGIQNPTRADGSLLATMNLENKSAVTSGLYERSFTKDDTFYHHILDPQTGMPVNSGVLGVSIVGESSFLCDMVSTTVFLLGASAGLAFLEEKNELSGIICLEANEVLLTPGFAATLADGITVINAE